MASIEAIHNKLTEIYDDISQNVTRIYNRQDLHLAMDLVWHSPLTFKFDGKIKKCYPEVLVIGDTRCGKTETAQRLLEHYGMGAFVSCEGATLAGILGGQVHSKKNNWFTQWGRIPRNHRRLVVLDEVSGMSADTISNLSHMRSAGIAELNKINSSKVKCMTRLVWLSNPRPDHRTQASRNLADFGSAIFAINDLIGRPEDVARFDYAIAVANQGQVDLEVIHKYSKQAPSPHRYTASLCQKLVLWCWSRGTNDVKYDEDVLEAVYECTQQMCEKYSSDFPLVNPSEQRIKLMRLAAGLAGRLFSCDDTGKKLIIRPEHVRYVTHFLNRIYDEPIFSYDRWSRGIEHSKVLVNTDKLDDVLKSIGRTMCNNIYEADMFELSTFVEMVGAERTIAIVWVHDLMECHAIVSKYGKRYQKTPAFTQYLRDFMDKWDRGEVEEKHNDF